MVRNRGKKSLYEVFGKDRPKSGYARLLEWFRSAKSRKIETIVPVKQGPMPEGLIRWPRRRRRFQFNAGRIEISIPYQIAVACLLGIVLLVLIFFRLGQSSYKRLMEKRAVPASMNIEKTNPASQVKTAVAERSASKSLGPIVSKANNRIVIQTWPERAQLEPIKEYFAGYGIKTEIRKLSDTYFLVTADAYESPKNEGSKGYEMRERIIQLGAKYKAPAGFATFGRRPFHDAYAMRFKN